MIAAVDPDAARHVAEAILGERRFEPDRSPRPLRGVLVWIEEHLIDPVARAVARAWDAVPWPIGVALLVLAAALLLVLIVRAVRSVARGRSGAGAAPALPRGAGEDPAELEEEALAAEARGDYERAVRLRFRAGLLRLGGRGAITYRPSVTTASVRARLRSPRFDELATTFEEVTYGTRVAGPPDAGAARREWPEVVTAATPVPAAHGSTAAPAAPGRAS